jgi:hypothetical protein
LKNNTTGSTNTAVGTRSMETNNSSGNTAVGYQSLAGTNWVMSITNANYNTALGYLALQKNEGTRNVGTGAHSLQLNTSGVDNTATGFYSLNSNTTASYNTAYGSQSLSINTGAKNTAYGYRSLVNNTSGANNTAFGYKAAASADNATNQTVIGYEATGQADNSVVLGNDAVTAVYMGEDSGAKVYAGEGSFTGNMTIGGDVVISSDARLKANIMSLGSTLAKLLLIDGKTYTMKKNGKQKIGVLAQDIQKVFPELVTTDDKEMLAVNYQGLVPVLINALKEQDNKISRLENLVEKLISDK